MLVVLLKQQAGRHMAMLITCLSCITLAVSGAVSHIDFLITPLARSRPPWALTYLSASDFTLSTCDLELHYS